jgi:asparaginyl-tRNA synthetase
MNFQSIHINYSKLIDNEIILNGWVSTIRIQKELIFVKLNDGTEPLGIQVIFNDNKFLDKIKKIQTGCSVYVKGKLILSPSQGQLFDIEGKEFNIIGNIDDNYPLLKSRMSLDYLREFCHLRFRTSTFGSVFRIRSSIMIATHQFFNKHNYLYLDPNIITINECEGGAGVFQVTELNLNNLTTKYDVSKDHFCKSAYLTVSSQLQLEAISCGLGAVYTVNKSFRSEHSNTSKHLSEFSHLEIENTFIDLEYLLEISEKYIKFINKYLLDNNYQDIQNLDKFVSKGLLKKMETFQNVIFNRITYYEAIKLINGVYGEDLSSEQEQKLTEHFQSPVYVTDWPIKIKSFYMKLEPNDLSICQNFDLLMPGKIGELIGGSMREENLELILSVMKEKNIDPQSLKFYMDLRKYGTVPHGGFGLGVERLVMFFTNMENIKDVVPFPIYYKNCNY